MPASAVDVLILGAGPAGLSAACGLARQLHTAIVFSSSVFRNARAKHMHNVPGWDHKPPSEFRTTTREQLLERYQTIQFEDVEVADVRKLENGRFEATDVDGHRYEGKKLILATGVTDVMPDIPGFKELWGASIFHCLFCHGYEERGYPSAGILVSGPLSSPQIAPAVSRMVARLTGHVTIYTQGNPALGAQLRSVLKSTKRFSIENRKVTSFSKDPEISGYAGLLVALEDGTVNKEGFVTHVPETVQTSPFAEQLGLELTPEGHVAVKPPMNMTNVPGIFAAGDCATMFKSVQTALFMGGGAAFGVCHTLQAEEDIQD